MSVSYTCPNPDCGVVLKTPTRVAVGKSVKCPKCARPFVPEPGDKAAAGAGVLKLAEEPKKPDPAPVAKKPAMDDEDDDESVKKGYGVIAETEAEKEAAEKNKPKFNEVKDKFKKSARGPAMSLLVMPSNLLTLEGLATGIAGIGMFVVGMWPFVFNDAPPGEEETEEGVILMMIGVVVLFWGAMVCFCASQMQELGSYPWAMVGSIMGIAPLLVGIYGIVMLQNPKVKAGFEEIEGNSEEGEEDDDDDEDEDDEDEDDDDDDDGGGKKKGGAKKLAKSAAKGAAKKLGRGLMKKALGGGDED